MDARAWLINRVAYPLWVRRNHSARLQYLAELERSQFWPREQLERHQLERLQAVVRHAWDNSDFYRARFETAGFAPGDLRTLADLARLPLITKEDIQANRDAMISSAHRGRPLIEDMTGGSTGAPMRFFYDTDRRDWREGATLRHDQWSGWKLGESRAILWGASQDMRAPPNLTARLREAWVERRMILDASALDEAAMESFARRLRAEQPVMLLAYANTLGLFARYVKESGISDIRPRAIITSAEVLTEENRALIEAVFGCPVFNRYGCREFAVIASQCEAQGPLHVNAENLLVETLVNGAPVTGTPGEIVITDLRNLAMPMIRYAIRDTGTLVAGSCSCGRHLPRLEMAAGRVTDFLTATSGQKVSGIVIATYVSTHIPGIGQMQIEQHERGRVAVRVVRGGSWNETARERLVARLREYLGPTMQVDVVYVDAIPHERSGKFRFSISHL